MAEVLYDKRLINVDESYPMGEVEILNRNDRVELIHGEIINMSPIGSKYASMVNYLSSILNQKLDRQVIVPVQNPLSVGETNEPEPDIAVLKFRADHYRNSHPTPEDVHLLIEVADTSLSFDKEIKSELYRQVGIKEYWLVDIENDRLRQLANPQNVSYQYVRKFNRTASIKSSELTIEIDCEELFG